MVVLQERWKSGVTDYVTLLAGLYALAAAACQVIMCICKYTHLPSAGSCPGWSKTAVIGTISTKNVPAAALLVAVPLAVMDFCTALP